MSRLSFNACFCIALLLCFTLSQAARPEPAFYSDSNAKDQNQGVAETEVDESCEGVGEEECLMMRRTLAAHLDYVYTKGHNRRP
ncbi:hypothetical protein K2173_002588 [Erythroxylum novogranatense]|uniref:Phytosulfokine n=1 Tax=Erythroxylum novogranatense TaxID=1862640 RepID=A0AAV8TTI6_9ROSI|nr:hypothetical protein K2173_002588 [Erythroxylum novogranatense]